MGETVIYARVSTPKQSVEHQADNLWEYATTELGVDTASVVVKTDVQSGTTDDRDAFQYVIDGAQNGSIDCVIAREVTRLGRDLRTIHELVYTLVEDHNVGLHVVNDDIRIPQGEDLSMRDKMYLSVLGWGAELEAKKLRENQQAAMQAAREQGKWPTRPPYGFTTNDDGYLVATDDYRKALAAIYAVEIMDWSQRKASRYSGVARRTIPNILDRKELYLPDKEFEKADATLPEEDFAPADDELTDTHDAVLTTLEHGSVPRDTIVSTLNSENYNERDVAAAMMELAVRGDIEPHPEFDACWRAK